MPSTSKSFGDPADTKLNMTTMVVTNLAILTVGLALYTVLYIESGPRNLRTKKAKTTLPPTE